MIGAANLLLLLVAVSLSSVVHPSSDGRRGRRSLHEPLVPIDYTPPPAPDTTSNPSPESPFFPDSPPQSNTPGGGAAGGTTSVQSAANVNAPGPPSSSSFKATTKLAVAASVSVVAAVALISLSCFLLYRRRIRGSSDTRKLIGGRAGCDTAHPSGRHAAAPDFLYLGTIDPSSRGARSGEATNGSPYRKLSTERALEVRQPSPELRPLPPLAGSGRQVVIHPSASPPMPGIAAGSSDDDETYYYTAAPWSVTSATNSDCPSSPVSRRSVTSASTVPQKDVLVHTVDSVPRSRRSSSRMHLPAYAPSDVVNQVIPPIARSPPHPPPPPPPPAPLQTHLKAENVTRMPPPPPPPPPPSSYVIMGRNGPPLEVSEVIKPMRPPGSRRQWVKPPLPEVARMDKFATLKLSNGDGSSSSHKIDEGDDDLGSNSKPKLKPLHWDKVKASSDRAMVWDQFKSSSFEVNEDMIETLFGNNSASAIPKETSRRAVLPQSNQEERVLDPKKSQNIAILLRALNVTREEVSEALLDGYSEGLGTELFDTLVKMAPTKEEELKLRNYTGDTSKLGSAERFLKEVLDIPFAFKRVDAMLYKVNFETEVNYLRKSFETLEAACEDLRSSKLFLKLLEAVLRTGNRMNVGTNRGEARAFKLDTLLKLADVKGSDGKTTLLHFVVQEIIRSEGSSSDATFDGPPNKAKEEEFRKQGLKVVAGLSSELSNVKKAATIDSDVLHSYISKLEMGLEKINSILQLEKSCNDGKKFFETMRLFVPEAQSEIDRVKAEEKIALSLVKEITEYFHGDAVREEAHPLRIFMVVRDFLSVLDHVCKEVGRMQERVMMGSARSFRISANIPLPVRHRFETPVYEHSDDDSSSSWSRSGK